MKKTITILITIVIISATMLAGCIDKSIHHWEFGQGEEQIVGLYIVDAETSMEYEIIKEIPLNEKEALLEDIKGLEFEKYFGMDPGEPCGMCFVIKYQDGAYDIISYFEPMQVVWKEPDEHFPNRYQTSLFFWLRCDYDEFNGLINKYMKTVDGGLS